MTQNTGNKCKNKQVGLHQSIVSANQQSEWTTYRMGENVYKLNI
jgi:hypothetical protein